MLDPAARTHTSLVPGLGEKKVTLRTWIATVEWSSLEAAVFMRCLWNPRPEIPKLPSTECSEESCSLKYLETPIIGFYYSILP